MSNPFDEINSRLSTIETILLDIKHKSAHPKPQEEQDEVLTVQEAAAFLKLTVQTIYGMIHERRINFMKTAKRVYFLKSDLIAFLKSNRTKTRNELIEEGNISGRKKG